MSVVQNPLIGRARQKLGGTVFSTWKGINVIKGKPLTVANPRTDAQIQQRSAMTQMVELGRSIYAAIFRGFNEQAVRKSQFNAFVGYNLRNAFDMSAPPTALITYPNLLVSQGTISETPISAASGSAAADDITVEWVSGTLLPGQSNLDTAQVVVIDRLTGQAQAFTAGVPRGAETYVVSLDKFQLVNGQTYDVYLFFYNANTRKTSSSVHTAVVAGV